MLHAFICDSWCLLWQDTQWLVGNGLQMIRDMEGQVFLLQYSLAECCKRQLNPGSFVLLYFRLFTFSDLYWVCLSVFSCRLLFCLSVSVKWLAMKTASEMTYIVSSGVLKSTPTNQPTNPVISMSVCLSVCLFAYFRKHMSTLRQIFCYCCHGSVLLVALSNVMYFHSSFLDIVFACYGPSGTVLLLQ